MSDLRVLVVEDEGIIAKDIQNTLNRSGYSVIAVAASGQEAIEKAMEMYPDIVLMDIVLEGDMDGVAAAEKIRDHFDIPVVYLTAYSDDTTLQRAKITEPYGYILKPFQERELYTTIEMALYKHKMEKKLKENEQWLATTLKSIGDAVIATDTSELITFMNPVAEALTGWKQEEAVGKPLKDVFKIINEKTGKEVEESVTRVIREGLVIGLANHTVLIARDGTKRPIDDGGAPIRDDKGRIIGVVLTFRDITEREKTEQKLKELNRAVEQSSQGIAIGDFNMKHVFVNQAWAKMHGYHPDDLIGTPISLLDSPEDKERLPKVWEDIKISGFWRGELKRVRKNGSSFSASMTGSLVKDDKGKPVAVIGTCQDITEYKQIQAQLKESEEKFRAIFEHATDGILVLDLETKKFLTGNSMICEMLGYGSEEINNLKVTDIHPDEDLPSVLDKIEEQARGEYTLATDIPVKRKDGSIFYADINSSPISLYGKPYIMGIFRDITETKRMQDSILKSEKQLRNLSSNILSTQEQERKRISRELHDDLGQILTAVLLDISRAEKQETILSSSSYGLLEHIRVGIKEALQRVRSLSAILRPGVLDQLGLKAAVISFLEEIQEQTGLKIIKEMQVDQSNIPESVSIAIYRILQEATTNIVKHAEAKQVIVKLQSDSKTISISIKDDGKGFQLESLPIDKGLGLLGMKERVEGLEGIFKIESAHGYGTSICAEFPLSSRKLET